MDSAKVQALDQVQPNVGDEVFLNMGLNRELLVNEVMGKYYAYMRQGRVYNISTVVGGVAYPISSSVTPVFGVWNPSDSGVLLVPLLFNEAYVSGTAVQTGINLAIVTATGALSNVVSGAPIAALTTVTPRNGLVGLGKVGKCLGFSTGTLTTAGTFLMSLGMNNFTGAATVPVTVAPQRSFDFQGCLGIPPGNFIYTMGNAASVSLHQQTLFFAEMPLQNLG